jgi:hypothetical protein
VRLFAALPEGLPRKGSVCGVANTRRATSPAAFCALHPPPLRGNGHHGEIVNTLLFRIDKNLTLNKQKPDTCASGSPMGKHARQLPEQGLLAFWLSACPHNAMAAFGVLRAGYICIPIQEAAGAPGCATLAPLSRTGRAGALPVIARCGFFAR